MLKRLLIQNYILIDELDIELRNGLTIVTGETGAGKSILLGALGLVLGQRADAGALLNKAKKCIVEGTFDISGYSLKTFFKENELDYENETSLRREINAEGKSRAFINDTPVTLNILRELAGTLVDIHSQHETLTLGNSKFQLSVVDAFAKNDELLSSFRLGYTQFTKLKKELAAMIEEERKSKADLDYFQFQFNELEEGKLKTGEQEQLESELELLTHAEEIKSNLGKAYGLLEGSEENLVQGLNSVTTYFSSLAKFDSKYAGLLDRIKSVNIELKDISSETEDLQQKLNADPARAEVINERLNVIYKLQQKHHVKTIDELIVVMNSVGEKLSSIGSMEINIQNLQKEADKLQADLVTKAQMLSAGRGKAISKIEKSIKELTNELAMPNAVLKIDMQTSEELNIDGFDKIVFLFSANKGTDYKELGKVASGGELSRLMLSIKSLLAKLSAMPTIIFDEIDTGISGEVASRVGTIMQNMSANHQVIAITHLPQIAGKGNEHLLVYKSDSHSTTRTGIRKLNDKERVGEVARMLSGEKLTDAAVEHAKELLN